MKRHKTKTLIKKPVPKNLLDDLEDDFEFYKNYNSYLKGIFLVVYFFGLIISITLMEEFNDFKTSSNIFLTWILVSSIPFLISLILFIGYTKALKRIEKFFFF